MNLPSIPKVYNMYSSNRNIVPNQFVIKTDVGKYFQSYDSMIAFKGDDGTVILDEKYWNWSKTTNKYRNDFLGEKLASTRAKIESGVYKLADLNP